METNPIAAVTTPHGALIIGRAWIQEALRKLNEEDVLGTWEIHARGHLEESLESLKKAAYWLGDGEVR